MPPYVPLFEVGSKVEIADSPSLWFAYAGKVGRVSMVGYYHGGDVLYELEGVPGVWHEVCLRKTGTGP